MGTVGPPSSAEPKIFNHLLAHISNNPEVATIVSKRTWTIYAKFSSYSVITNLKVQSSEVNLEAKQWISLVPIYSSNKPRETKTSNTSVIDINNV